MLQRVIELAGVCSARERARIRTLATSLSEVWSFARNILTLNCVRDFSLATHTYIFYLLSYINRYLPPF